MITKTKVRQSRMYGVTERKKEELDALSLQVLDAQQQVDQFQAIVTALTAKQSNFNALLASADAARTSALNNKNTVDQVVQNFKDLLQNSTIGVNAMAMADQQTKKLAVQITNLINKLIYSAEVINKLGTYVVRKKAANPLVSDELVSLLTTAGNDANNAVALTLVALQSTFTAQASNMESEAVFALEFVQARTIYNVITGQSVEAATVVPAPDAKGKRNAKIVTAPVPPPAENTSLQKLLRDAYDAANEQYKRVHEATDRTTKQLNDAQINLNEAQMELQSLQLGLAAGNAAALAS